MLNSSIILSGQQGNTVNALAQGTAAAAAQNDVARQRARDALFKEQGAAIAAGDQNALNALAQFDPTATLAIQGQRQDQQQSAGRYTMAQEQHATQQEGRTLDMQATRQRMAMMDRDEQRAIAAHASALSSAEAAAQAADIENDVKVMATAQSAEQWDILAEQTGNPDMKGQFENREAVIAPYLSLQDLLKRQEVEAPDSPAWRAATPQEAAQYGAQAGQVNQETGKFEPARVSDGMRITQGPDGGFSIEQGPGVTGGVQGNGKSLTVEEGKNTGFLLRAQESADIIDQLENEGTSLTAKLANGVPVLGNYAQTPEYRQYDQARRDFVNAVLRRESGAVISEQEFANAELQYFPQPGDDPATIAQKRANREKAVQGFAIGAGDGVNRIQQQPAAQAPQPTPTREQTAEPEAIQSFGIMSAEEILGADIPTTVEGIAEWNKRMDELGL